MNAVTTEFERVPNEPGYYISSNAPSSGEFVKKEDYDKLRSALELTNNELQDWAIKGGGKNSLNIISDNLTLLKGN